MFGFKSGSFNAIFSSCIIVLPLTCVALIVNAIHPSESSLVGTDGDKARSLMEDEIFDDDLH